MSRKIFTAGCRLAVAMSLLASLLALCAVSQSASAQTAGDKRPAGFDPNRLDKITDVVGTQSSVGVQIGDMTFIGKMCPRNYSSANPDLDKLIKETLDEMGLTEEEFNKLAEEAAEGFQEQRDKMREALEKFWSTPDQPRKSQDELQEVLNGMMNEQNEGKLNDFYRRLNEKLKKQPTGEMVIEFKDAIAGKKTFTFFGQPCTEQWTLNMILKGPPGGSLKADLDKGTKLEGDYTIGIKYDLSAFAKNAKSVVETRGWLDKYGYKVWDQTWGLTLTQTNTGVCNATRVLTGKAIADISPNFIDPSHKIVASPAGDQKNVNITGITLNATGGDESQLNIDFTVSADKDTLHFNIIKWIVDHGDGTSTGNIAPLRKPEIIPWDRSIWTRGDGAGAEWELRVLP